MLPSVNKEFTYLLTISIVFEPTVLSLLRCIINLRMGQEKNQINQIVVKMMVYSEFRVWINEFEKLMCKLLPFFFVVTVLTIECGDLYHDRPYLPAISRCILPPFHVSFNCLSWTPFSPLPELPTRLKTRPVCLRGLLRETTLVCSKRDSVKSCAFCNRAQLL